MKNRPQNSAGVLTREPLGGIKDGGKHQHTAMGCFLMAPDRSPLGPNPNGRPHAVHTPNNKTAYYTGGLRYNKFPTQLYT
jgi:hypothetical protein